MVASKEHHGERSRFISPWTLLIISAVLVLALVLLFPARRFSTLSHSAQQARSTPDSVSISYLQALLKANPEDTRLRVNLAVQQLDAGQLDKAGNTLAPLENDNDPDVQWLLLQVGWQTFNAADPDSRERAERRGALIARMKRLANAPDATDEHLQVLANRWLAFGEPGRAALIYDRLGDDDAALAYQWHSLAGRWWLAAHESEKASQSWQQAFEAANDPGDRRTAALAALDAARQKRSVTDLDLAERFIKAYRNDPTFLDIGVDMALARDRLDRAQQWSDRYIALRPDDEKALERATRIALARNEIDAALKGLETLVERNPDDSGLRAQLAQVQVWAGQPQAALANYERLARNAGADRYDVQVIDLAEDLHDKSAILKALDRMRRRHPLDTSQRRLLADILNSEGQPDRAISLLSNWVQGGRADRQLWVRRAVLQEQTGDIAGALSSWQAVASHYGRGLEETQARSRLLTRAWRLEDALSVMRSLPDKPAPRTEEQVYYWKRTGALAWNIHDEAAARDAYYPLFLDRKLDAAGYLRLAQAAVDTGRMDMAMRVARADWRDNRHPEMIVQMLGAAQRARRSDLTRELIRLSAQQPDLFAGSAEYWQLYGDYQFDERDLDKARIAYLRALNIAPGDAAVRSALIYTLAESGRLQQLRRYVIAWHAAAWRDSGQWQAFAAAYSRLGETRKAIAWYDRAVRSNPENYLLVLDYADALERGRRFDSARRMRRYALVELRPRLMHDLNRRGLLTGEQRERDARILGAQAAMLGPESNRGWLRLALQGRRGGRLNAVDIEMLLGYYLSLDQPSYTRYWLLQAQRRRLATEHWQQLVVALQSNDQVTMQKLLLATNEDSDIGISDRINALRQLDFRQRALTLALDHERPGEPYVNGIDIVPRYAAELYREMPQNYGTRLSVRRISDLDVTGESAFLRLSGERLSTRLELGARQIDDNGLDIDLDGLDNERFATLEVDWRERRGQTTFRLGTVQTDADDLLQLGIIQNWQLTGHVGVSLFGHYNELPNETGQLRVLGVRDQLGGTLDWTLNSRDSVTLTTAYSRFHSRERRSDLGQGYSIEAAVAHALMVGPTHQLQVRGFANTEHNTLADDLPDDVAARLPAGTDPADVVPSSFSFIGAGLSISRGTPGAEYPLVASPRYRLDIDTGYVLPDNQIGVSANVSIGSRILGSDELSLNVGFDQTGSGARQNSYNGSIEYQYFLGR